MQLVTASIFLVYKLYQEINIYYRRKIILCVLGALAFVLAALIVQPFAPDIDAEATLIDGAGTYQPEKRRMKDATYLVAVRTPLPG